MTSIHHNLRQTRRRISISARNCERNPEEITLVAVSKNKSVSQIKEAIAEGQTDFGENYVQEAVEKIRTMLDYPGLRWHFIGTLQSNKSRLVAENFDWCHTIDRYQLAQRLHEQRPLHLPPLNVLIQINIDNEETKSGISLDQLNALAEKVMGMPRLCLRGIMAMPRPSGSCRSYTKLADVLINLRSKYPMLDTLSLGMSDDIDEAIAAGSTMLRIGTSIFGARPAHSLSP